MVENTTSAEAPPPKQTRVILSIDGGGIRGVLVCKVLMYLQNQLRKQAPTKKQRNLPLCDWFDLIAGTSTGGIISAAMSLNDFETGAPAFTAGTLLEFYQDVVGTMFTPPAKQSIQQEAVSSVTKMFRSSDRSAPTDQILFQYFSRQKLSGCRRKTLIPAYEINLHHPYLFRSWQAKQNRNRDYLLDQVVRAATAAPLLFTPAVLPRAIARRRMVGKKDFFLNKFFKSQRTDIIHAFALTTVDERQNLDRVLAMSKQERSDTYDAVRKQYSAEEWKDTLTDDLKVRSILDVRTEGDELYYTNDEQRDFSSHEASGKGQEFLTCIDGSIYANNPAMLAYTEALEVFGDDNLVIISIGTGRTQSLDFSTAKEMKREEWVKPVLDILKEGVQDSISAQLETLARSKVKTNELQFVRINMELDRKSGERFGQAPSTDLAATSEENKKRLARYGDKMVADNKEILDQLVELMISCKPGCTRD